MNNLPDNQFKKMLDDEIDFRELFYVLWNKKFYIASTTSIFILIFIAYALILPNTYKSKAIMMPVETNSAMNGMLGQYSGIAGLAGISLPSGSSSKSQEAIARIKSFEFFSNNFLPYIKLENLLAVTKWNEADNTLVYNESIFNSDSGQWLHEAKPTQSKIPSSQLAYKKYKEIMSISEDVTTSFVTLSVEHISPLKAQQWVNLIIDQIDQVMKDKDRQESIKAIEYLNNITLTIKYEEIKKSLSSLQQEQMKRLMILEASENYIFKVLDSPLAPEIKFGPKRSLIVILGAILGMITSTLGVLTFHFIRKSSKYNLSN